MRESRECVARLHGTAPLMMGLHDAGRQHARRLQAGAERPRERLPGRRHVRGMEGGLLVWRASRVKVPPLAVPEPGLLLPPQGAWWLWAAETLWERDGATGRPSHCLGGPSQPPPKLPMPLALAFQGRRASCSTE